MAALAALEITRKQKAGAVSVAAGVAAGDLMLAVAAILLLNVKMKVDVPNWLPVVVAVAVLLGLAGWIWKDSAHEVKPAEGYHSFWGAMLVTLANPGNIAAYLALYTGVLPDVAGAHVGDLSILKTVVLLVATGLGLALGWALFLGVVQAAVNYFGALPKRIQPLMARAVSLLMVIAAAVLVVTFLLKSR